jgi:uncharacterized protein
VTDDARGAPIAESERAGVLDALRGFALLGIFVSHLPAFSGYEFLPAARQAALDPLGIDRGLTALCEFFIRGKFFSLFSLLFGIGFSVQLESARRRGARFGRHFTRRLAVLFALGVLHGLIWYGDILRDYAVLGLLLLPTARWDARKTGRAAIALLLARVAWPFLVFAIAAQLAPIAAATTSGDPSNHFFESTRAFASASWRAAFSANLELLRLKALQMLYEGKAISILGMFFLGATIGRMRLHVDLASSPRTLRRAFAWCAPIGVLGNLVLVPLHAATPAYPPTLGWVADEVLFAVAVPALTIAYASGFALLYSGAARAVLRAFAPAGRMALSTYIGQTWIGIALFYGVGLGFGETVGQAGCIGIAVAIFFAQSALAALWLRRFRFGPLEWCWRRATYGVPVPMARALDGTARGRAAIRAGRR